MQYLIMLHSEKGGEVKMNFGYIEDIFDEEGRLVPNHDGFYESQEHYDAWQHYEEKLRERLIENGEIM